MPADYLSCLADEEARVIMDADALLRSRLPVLDAEKSAYATRNLSLQSDLNSLRMGYGYHCSQLIAKLRQREFALRRDAREEGARDRDERACAIHCDSKWSDLNGQTEQITAVMRRAESLEWMLKNALEFVKR